MPSPIAMISPTSRSPRVRRIISPKDWLSSIQANTPLIISVTNPLSHRGTARQPKMIVTATRTPHNATASRRSIRTMPMGSTDP